MQKWYETLEIYENPFEPNPLKDIERELIGKEEETKEIIYRIISGNMLFIQGMSGSGKTALLKKAIDKFKGKGKVIYVDSRLINKKLNIENLLQKTKSLPRKILGKQPTGMILLIDNVEELTARNNERIKYYFDQNYLKAVIFTGESYEKATLSDSIRSRIGNRIIYLTPLTNDEVISAVKDRLGEKSDILPDEIIKYLYEKSGRNLKEFMINAFKVCEKTVEAEKKEATKKIVDSVMKADIDDEELKEEIKEEHELMEKAHHCLVCGNELVQIGEYYRCDYCDTYCPKCGSMVAEDEKKCPECGQKFSK